MKIKISEAEGQVLDYLVAKCIYEPDDVVICEGRVFAYDDSTNGFNPSTDWSQGGPIIERERICLIDQGGDYWQALWGWKESFGPTPLIAAMRCYIASKLGDEVEVPDGLN